MNSGIEDLVKKYGLIKEGQFLYRWEVSGIEINGYVIKELRKNRFMIAKEINAVYSGPWTPHIEHNLWLEVESYNIEGKLKELKKQWEDAVIQMKEYKMKEKMERIDGDF